MILSYIRTKLAQRRLQRMVETTCQSYQHLRYIDRRRAALKGHALKRERARG